MNSQDAIAVLRAHADELRKRGARHAALFGSLARGEADSNSDIDIMIQLDPAHRISLFSYVALKRFIADLFDRPVDVVDMDALKTYVRGSAISDAINAF